MSNIKYINNRRDGFVIFSPGIGHDEMLRNLGWKKEDCGAGFIKLATDPDEIEVFGKSVSLGIESKPEDAQRIIRTYRGN